MPAAPAPAPARPAARAAAHPGTATLTVGGADVVLRAPAMTIGRLAECEIALADQAADQAHRSFSNLFVETEALRELEAHHERIGDDRAQAGDHARRAEAATSSAVRARE